MGKLKDEYYKRIVGGFSIALILCMLTEVILLSVRFDYFLNINYLYIIMPAVIPAGITTVTSVYGIVYNLSQGDKFYEAMRSVATAAISQGFLWSQFLLAMKLEHITKQTYLNTLIPLMIAGLIATVVIILGLVYGEQKRYSKDKGG
jgi:hypothetical protein